VGSAEDGYGVAGGFCGGAVSGHRRSCGEGGCVGSCAFEARVSVRQSSVLGLLLFVVVMGSLPWACHGGSCVRMAWLC